MKVYLVHVLFVQSELDMNYALSDFDRDTKFVGDHIISIPVPFACRQSHKHEPI